MTHPTIEAMAREICAETAPCGQDFLVEIPRYWVSATGDAGQTTMHIPAWKLHGEEAAKSAARALLTAEPSEAEIFAAASAMYENGYYCHGPEISKINDATRAALKAARAALMKEMGL